MRFPISSSDFIPLSPMMLPPKYTWEGLATLFRWGWERRIIKDFNESETKLSPEPPICHAINTYPVSDKSNSRTTLALAVIGVKLTWVLVLQWKRNNNVYFKNVVGFSLPLNYFGELNSFVQNACNCISKQSASACTWRKLTFPASG